VLARTLGLVSELYLRNEGSLTEAKQPCNKNHQKASKVFF